jgi:hypothetical protein
MNLSLSLHEELVQSRSIRPPRNDGQLLYKHMTNTFWGYPVKLEKER